MLTVINTVGLMPVLTMQAGDEYEAELLRRLHAKFQQGRGAREVVRTLDSMKESFHHG